MNEAVAEYLEKFPGKLPTLIGVPFDMEEQVCALLRRAVDEDKPFESDAEFYAALGIEGPPEDADV